MTDNERINQFIRARAARGRFTVREEALVPPAAPMVVTPPPRPATFAGVGTAAPTLRKVTPAMRMNTIIRRGW